MVARLWIFGNKLWKLYTSARCLRGAQDVVRKRSTYAIHGKKKGDKNLISNANGDLT